MDNKYVKVVYQSEPIGKERIILYLTTFDIEKYNDDMQLKKVECKIVKNIDKKNVLNDASHGAYFEYIEYELNRMVKNFYEPYINEIIQLKKTMPPIITDDIQDVINADKITCNVIYGDVKNCDVIYCNEIKGKVVNCDKIIYKGGKHE